MLAEDVAGIVLQSFDTQCDEKDILIMFQMIARVVFHYQQSNVVSLKEGENSGVMNEVELESDSDDALLRIAGAQLHRMISVRRSSHTIQCTLQLPEVHMFIGITRFVRNVWAHVTFH